ncbi:RDD family protein [Longimicrobium terrae]|uniref:Putative RDD family membrane protein YckC n=1 Tax=Longimicrobium terrae TaxID=1639882 RepID=A0A841H893_9BACT|nr:RDD family protein [Longimicrobium terrae]MBB4639538.1 putative RDD family membrane protein YckC [Longimicrobium terrae]MBB6073909.1 putative RDD family membrane protein YckC [Longimicrobium terrae]NNC30106.1 RDD family protein [Longimicrobium terrae]
MPLASRGTRLFAQFIDGFVGLIAFIPAGIFLLVDETAGGLAIIAAVFFYFAYLLFSDALPGGQSMGKRMLGIAVVDHRTYQPCTGGQSFVRNLLLCILGFFDWIFILGDTKRRLGDIVAGTIVISTTPVYQAAPYQSAPAWPS